MKGEGKSSAVSRRDFLKGLGGGAVSTAVISSSLLNSNSGVAHAAAPTRKNIPADITLDAFGAIRGHLLEILKVTGAAVVNVRLNKTGIAAPAPVFVGWVEDDTLKKRRGGRNEPDPGFSRLGDTITSQEYTDTLAAQGTILERDWCVSLDQKSPDQKALLPRAGVMYQKLIGIIVQEGSVRRCVGALNVGFRRRPDAQTMQKAEKLIRHWAQDQGSKLVASLKQNFEFGGPTL